MMYHLSEAYLWLHPDIKNNFIKSLAIQWKAGGSFVGSWNMLVYGTAIYLMAKIKGDDSIGRQRKSFFFYFLGLTNLMFGWAHHIYIVPTAPWVRYVAYGISMTEWIILFHMLYEWKKSLPEETKIKNLLPYKFLVMADVWVFLNLILALLFSIPAINFFTHGTHITVAHSMGTTIGINTTILLASVLFIVNQIKPDFKLVVRQKRLPDFQYFAFAFLAEFTCGRSETQSLDVFYQRDSIFRNAIAVTLDLRRIFTFRKPNFYRLTFYNSTRT